MAIDGVNLRVFGLDPSLWLHCEELAGLFEVKVSRKTGKPIDGVKKATYRGLRFEINPRPDGTNGMSVRGSLHRYFNDGRHNCNQFYFADLVQVVKDLESRFSLCLDQVMIENVEVGVNMALPFEVKKVLTSLISYSDKTFEALDGRLPLLGRICPSFDFDIKVYDKVAQAVSASSLPPSFETDHLLRLEISTNKMRWLRNCGIKTLADLTKREKVYPVVDLITAVLSKIIFVDIDADMSILSAADRALYGLFRDRDKWRRFDKRKRYKMKAILPGLLKKCNAFDYAEMLRELLRRCWELLFSEANSGGLLHRLPVSDTASEAEAKGTLAHFIYNGAIVLTEGKEETVGGKEEKKEEKEKKRSKTGLSKPGSKFCRCCGKDISGQRTDSRFCSEKYQGRAAKKCRNHDSNHRRDKKKIVMKAKEKDQYLTISYLYKGVVYSDVLHASEVNPSRQWLDAIVSVALSAGDPDGGQRPLVYSEAREYIRALAARNAVNGV